ncbi:MAG: hypothetical protein DRJ51_09180 [Thermoprotei archaeon]|nr:MAG: hypothetical protein DRJ51_09180 [Thermoprotei archaeon]RLF01242.1 MAG: hypothetical protein DRJ59_06505 [Thermoprotei archaeon]
MGGHEHSFGQSSRSHKADAHAIIKPDFTRELARRVWRKHEGVQSTGGPQAQNSPLLHKP